MDNSQRCVTFCQSCLYALSTKQKLTRQTLRSQAEEHSHERLEDGSCFSGENADMVTKLGTFP